jgi:hypothetical protein
LATAHITSCGRDTLHDTTVKGDNCGQRVHMQLRCYEPESKRYRDEIEYWYVISQAGQLSEMTSSVHTKCGNPVHRDVNGQAIIPKWYQADIILNIDDIFQFLNR